MCRAIGSENACPSGSVNGSRVTASGVAGLRLRYHAAVPASAPATIAESTTGIARRQRGWGRAWGTATVGGAPDVAGG